MVNTSVISVMSTTTMMIMMNMIILPGTLFPQVKVDHSVQAYTITNVQERYRHHERVPRVSTRKSTPRSSSTSTLLCMGKRSTSQLLTKQWLPSTNGRPDDDIYASDVRREQLESRSLEYLGSIIRKHLNDIKTANGDSKGDAEVAVEVDNDNLVGEANEAPSPSPPPDDDLTSIVKGSFKDLTCNPKGEKLLEELILSNPPELSPPSDSENDENNGDFSRNDIVRAAVIAAKSLLIMGTQVGVKGGQEQQQRSVSHLYKQSDYSISESSSSNSNANSQTLENYLNNLTPRQLKHQVDVTAATQLLSLLKRKRSTQSAYDLLIQLGIWEKHEDIALLRSGFPLRFTSEECSTTTSANTAEEEEKTNEYSDPDTILGLRRDFRSMKVYTIDGEYTNEVDDGLSIESITKKDGTEKYRIWIHIADADRWAPRDSKIFKAAQRRATSVYTPTGSISMFPATLSAGLMSLGANKDSYALSLGVELNDDGSIDERTIQVTPSIINVDYRLTYEEVEEMLEMGIGYFEEWELGALLSEANKRREFRIANGSTEGFVPNPIPQAELRVEPNADAEDGIDIIVKVETTHNAGYNQSSTLETTNPIGADNYSTPVSSSFLLVTEMMIMSGEAMGKFKTVVESSINNDNDIDTSLTPQLPNGLDLPYRTQARPDFAARYQEINTLDSLKDRGYCHAWYARRFFAPVRVMSEMKPHYGLGLDCYVQWSSPIRRFSDIQVHAAVKRFLRREKINRLIRDGKPIPDGISDMDLGCAVPTSVQESKNDDGNITKYVMNENGGKKLPYLDINYKSGIGFIKAARMVQRKSNEYWLFEYIRRRVEESDHDVEFEATVLGCVDPVRFQYAIYVYELGLEHRYLSEKGYLPTGSKLSLKVASVSPLQGLLTFILSSKYNGRSSSNVAAAA